MKECKKIRKLTRKTNLRFLYLCYIINCYNLDITVNYKTFKSYCNKELKTITLLYVVNF